MAHEVPRIYAAIIDDVIENIQAEFEAEGIDPEICEELKLVSKVFPDSRTE